MVKKLQKMANKKAAAPMNGFNPAALLDGHVAQGVRDSAQQIWAAGLAAFSKAQGEGTKVFDTLVKEGMTLQQKTQTLAEKKFGAVAEKMTGVATEVGAKAGQHWDKLESIFEERVARALKSLGVPSGKDISALIARIDALSTAVGFAPVKQTVAKKPAAKPAAKPVAKAEPKKAAADKAPAKKAPLKKAAAKPAPAKKAVEAKAAPAKKATVKKAAKPAVVAKPTAAPAADAPQA
ncbi:phasin family protein [Inhella sp. 4Y17]|uniref:Phasin family protein n=2 Tax=Inhella gelatinilytica TaxID=2795030 RepID=A0A931NAE5_9BURK|nr:phasin family protein [Inhella gelatinilytica]